jgi:peptide/nickel transport system permease protein
MSAIAAERSVWAKSFSVVLRSRLSLLGVILVLGLVSVAAFAPFLAAYDPLLIDLPKRDQAPNWDHPLGTDTFGRDVLSRILWGSRLSLLLGLGSVTIGGTVGVLLG